MGEATAIEWAHSTFNPWWGCARVSPGCEHCYAETFAKRVGRDVWGSKAPRLELSDHYWQQPERWNHKAAKSGEPWRVFCGSMCDVFEDRRDLDASRGRLFELVESTPALTWLLLTKRPQNASRLAPRRWGQGWPRNVVFMFTAEDNARFADRLPYAWALPGVRIGVSMEPLLGPIDTSVDSLASETMTARNPREMTFPMEAIDWVIVGGESGPGARPMHPRWVRDIRDVCVDVGVPFLFKQWGEWAPDCLCDRPGPCRDIERPRGPVGVMYRCGKKRAGRILDGRTWDGFPPEVSRD